MLDKVLEELRKPSPQTDHMTYNRRYRERSGVIKSGTTLEVAGVLRDLWREIDGYTKDQRVTGFGERKMLEECLLRLAGDLGRDDWPALMEDLRARASEILGPLTVITEDWDEDT